MDKSTRTLIMAGAAVAAAISLTFASVAAQDEAADEDTDTMAPMEEMEPGLHVLDPWARESPMLELAGAAYMVIHNNTDADDALVGASSEAAEFVELHLSSMDEEGMMSMNQVAEIPIPAHGDAVLKAGSYHVMLINLVEPLVEGAEVQLELEFMTAEPQTISAPVLAGMPMMSDMDMDMTWDMDMDDGHGRGCTRWTRRWTRTRADSSACAPRMRLRDRSSGASTMLARPPYQPRTLDAPDPPRPSWRNHLPHAAADHAAGRGIVDRRRCPGA